MWKKKVAVLMCATLLIGIVSGCGKKDESSKNDSGKDLAKLQLVLYGEESARMTELMNNEFKQELKNNLNIELKVTYVPWSEYGGEKINLMLANGEDFATYTDAKFTAQCANKGLLADLTEAAKTCIPDLKEQVNPAGFDVFTIDDKLYSIPMGSRPSSGEAYCFSVRQDLLEEVGMSEVTSIEDLEKFYDLCKEKHPEYVGLCNSSFMRLLNYQISDKNIELLDNINDNAALAFVDADTDDDKVYSLYESEEFKKLAEITHKWYEKGIIPEYILSNPTQLTTDWNSGKGMMTFGNGTSALGISTQPQLMSMVPEAKLKNYFLGTGKAKINSQPYNTAWLVSAGGEENVENYLKLFNYMQQSQENIDLLTYGIEGKDYTLNEEGRIKRTNTDVLFDDWLLFNKNYMRYNEVVTDEEIEAYETWDDGSILGKGLGFQFDEEPVKVEKARLDSVVAEYGLPIMYGVVSYKDGYDELISKLKEAGLDKYMEELQKQFTEFRKSK